MTETPVELTHRQRLHASIRPWYQIWWSAVSRPTRATYDQIVQEGRLDHMRVYRWILSVALVSGFVTLVPREIGLVLYGQPVGGISPSPTPTGIMSFLTYMVAFEITFAFAFFLSMILLAIFIHLLARLLGGQGSFTTLLFAFSASILPITAVNSILQAIPVVMYLSFVTSFYGAILNIYAVRSTYSLGTGKALGVMVLVSILVIGAAALIASFIR